MLRNFTAALTMASLLLLGACGDDDGDKPDGPITLVDGSTPNQDGGVQQDTGAGNTLDCLGIVTCVSSCGATDMACYNACVAQAKDQQTSTTFTALENCLNTAGTTTCATACSNPSSNDCLTCIQGECSAEVTACQGGGGTPEAGFGKVCNQTTPCDTGYSCILLSSGATAGVCTKTCDNFNPPGLCTGAPTGTVAACVLGDTGGTAHYCAFICKSSQGENPCPSELTCGTTENPPSSGQYFCEPPAAQ